MGRRSCLSSFIKYIMLFALNCFSYENNIKLPFYNIQQMSFVRSIFNFYRENAPTLIIFTTVCGAMISISNEAVTDEMHTPQEMFTNIVGLTSTGFLTGVFFPLSFPLLSAFVMMKKQIKLITKNQ